MNRLFIVALTVTATAELNDVVRASSAGQAIGPATARSLLTKDVLAAHTPVPPANFRLMISVPPQEDKIRNGTACSFGGVTLQVDAFAPVDFEPNFRKYVVTSGVGDKPTSVRTAIATPSWRCCPATT